LGSAADPNENLRKTWQKPSGYAWRSGLTARIDPAGFPTGASSSSGVDQFSKQLLAALLSLRDGDLAVRLPSELTGVNGKIADAFNDIAKSDLASRWRSKSTAVPSTASACDRLSVFTSEVTRVGREVGADGRVRVICPLCAETKVMCGRAINQQRKGAGGGRGRRHRSSRRRVRPSV
jgi:hypothetical protein